MTADVPPCSAQGCTEPRTRSMNYCRKHKNDYQLAWHARRRARLLLERADALDPSQVDKPWPVRPTREA